MNEQKKCHCVRTDRLGRIDSNYTNHTFERCWTPNDNKTEESWEERFDEQFGICNGGDALYAIIDDDGLSVKQYLKAFISQIEASAYKRGRDKKK